MPADIRIFDCFTFFNELDMLELRLRHHYTSVDYFVICEATQTFRGASKPLHFRDNMYRFREFLPKIIHVVIDDLPTSHSPWDRENFQRNAIARGLLDARPEDQIIISDCDELLTHQALGRLRESRGFTFFDMAMYQFFANMRAFSAGWLKAYAFPWGEREKLHDFNAPRQRERKFYNEWPGDKQLVEDAGWHFTFLGGADRVRQKLMAYSHTDDWQRQMLNGRSVEDQLVKLRDVGGGRFLEYCEVDESFPPILRAKYQHYVDIGFIKAPIQRIRDLESTVVETVAQLNSIGDFKGKLRYLEAKDQFEWDSREIQCRDLALGKPCTQSSVSDWSNFTNKEADAAGAVNGRITGEFGFHTSYELDPWWQVDLETPCRISKVCIFNRADQAKRLKHFSVLVSVDGTQWEVIANKSDDQVFGASVSDPYVVPLDPPVVGRYLRVRLDGKGFLHFDECMVFGSSSIA